MIQENGRHTSAPIVFVGLVLVLASMINAGSSMPYNTDCMKNPFASGCRGISAKRSPPQLWSSVVEQSAGSGETQPSRASFYDIISAHQTNQLRSRQLSAVIELLLEVTNKLVNLADWNGPYGGKQLQGQTASLIGNDYLLSATKRVAQLVPTSGKRGEREEASK